jgi:hypothetical protein
LVIVEVRAFFNLHSFDEPAWRLYLLH